MFTRRELLKAGAMGGAALVLPLPEFVRRAAAQTVGPISGLDLTPYIDPLPIPSVLRPTGYLQGVAQYQVAMTQFTQRLHSQLPMTRLWGYAGKYPGPRLRRAPACRSR